MPPQRASESEYLLSSGQVRLVNHLVVEAKRAVVRGWQRMLQHLFRPSAFRRGRGGHRGREIAQRQPGVECIDLHLHRPEQTAWSASGGLSVHQRHTAARRDDLVFLIERLVSEFDDAGIRPRL
jgi:hypothetical protein